MLVPAFSVVIPAHNALPYVLLCLETVMNQVHRPDEVILVDNASTDSTALEVKRRFPNVRIIPEARKGVSFARNRGIEEARGDFVAFLDADDLWSRHHLAVLAQLIARHPAVSLAGTISGKQLPANRLPANGHHLQDFVEAQVAGTGSGSLSEIDYFVRAAGVSSPFDSSSVALRRSIYHAHRLAFRDYADNEDLLFWCEVALQGTVALAETQTGVRLLHGRSATAQARARVWGRINVDCSAYKERPLFNHLIGRLEGLEDPQRRSVERYLDGLVTGSWRSTLYLGLQHCARLAVHELRRPWHPQAFVFVAVAFIPKAAGRFLSALLRRLRPLDDARLPLSPFMRG